MNKDVNLNLNIEESKTIRYFQPVITNNTVIIPAKRLQENISEAMDKEPKVEDNKVEYKNLSSINIANEKEVTYRNLSSSFGEPKKEVIKEEINEVTNEVKVQELKPSLKQDLTIEEIIIEEVKPAKDVEEVKTIDEGAFMMKLEDMAKIFEEKQAIEEQELKDQELNKEELKEESVEEIKEQKENAIQEENSVNKDNTTKMDIPFVEGMETESIPQRREIIDNLKEMKSKLFLLASNAKKPVRICVNKKVFLMGSDYAKMDCVIRNNRYISRCHAKIYYETGCYFIEDVGSMNGTYINGVKLAEGIKYKLETGDLINLADCKFEVDIKN